MGDFYGFDFLNHDSDIYVADAGNKYPLPLEERIFDFVIDVINFLKSVKYSPMNSVLINQLTKSATSIGANYEESQGASSKKDFLSKMTIAHKESRETNYWLRIFRKAKIHNCQSLSELIGESYQIRNILGSIVGKVRKSIKN